MFVVLSACQAATPPTPDYPNSAVCAFWPFKLIALPCVRVCVCVWQEKCNNYLNDCSAHMWLPQNLPHAFLPPPSNLLSLCMLCPCFLYVSPFPNPLLLSLSPSLPAVLLPLSTESPFSLLATGHLSLSFSPPPSLSLCHLSQTSPQAFLERMLQLLLSLLFPSSLILFCLYVLECQLNLAYV